MIKINSKEEKNRIFKENITDIGSYAIVKYNNQEECIWISRFPDFDKDGDYFLEAPTTLEVYDFNRYYNMNTFGGIQKAIESYFELFEKNAGFSVKDCPYVQRDIISILNMGKYYDIDSPQTGPFLPDEFEIDFISEAKAIEYILKQEQTIDKDYDR